MPAQKRKSIYNQSVRITHTYLGPAAGRFVDRQVRNHLRKEPEDMTANDLKQLIEWIRLAVSLLTSDAQVVEEYIGQLQQLVGGTRS